MLAPKEVLAARDLYMAMGAEEGAATDMAFYDALPREIQDAIDNGSSGVDAATVYPVWKQQGTKSALSLIKSIDRQAHAYYMREAGQVGMALAEGFKRKLGISSDDAIEN